MLLEAQQYIERIVVLPRQRYEYLIHCCQRRVYVCVRQYKRNTLLALRRQLLRGLAITLRNTYVALRGVLRALEMLTVVMRDENEAECVKRCAEVDISTRKKKKKLE